ncbi:MAG: DUF4249 domain-containing protein [Ignavibacteriaceae bacterium]|nr:DUF4249 domain-containing protein [Ignavibacteriaceae bacterium]
MKSLLITNIVLLLFFLVTSCEENFSPKSEYKEKYVLYCIINIDSSKQTAALLKSYDVDGFDPYSNTESSFVSDADIRIIQKDQVFFMRDTSAMIDGVSRYSSPISFYYLDNFSSSSNDSIEIIAFLPSGKKLYGTAKAPETIEFDKASDKILPPEESDLFSFFWNGPVSSRWYLPKLTFYYSKDGITHEKEIPVTYELKNGIWTPLYPSITNSNYVNFAVAALDSAFLEISRNDPNKSSYKIYGAMLSLLVFDENLSNYYSTTNGFLDDFTLILDEVDYTNIVGGLGIFGVYRQQQTGVIFDEEYIKSFGYTPGLK